MDWLVNCNSVTCDRVGRPPVVLHPVKCTVLKVGIADGSLEKRWRRPLSPIPQLYIISSRWYSLSGSLKTFSEISHIAEGLRLTEAWWAIAYFRWFIERFAVNKIIVSSYWYHLQDNSQLTTCTESWNHRELRKLASTDMDLGRAVQRWR